MKVLKKLFGLVLTLLLGFTPGWIFGFKAGADVPKFKDKLIKKITFLLYGEERELKPTFKEVHRPYYSYASYTSSYRSYKFNPRLRNYIYKGEDDANYVLDYMLEKAQEFGHASVSDLVVCMPETFESTYIDTRYGWTEEQIKELTPEFDLNDNITIRWPMPQEIKI